MADLEWVEQLNQIWMRRDRTRRVVRKGSVFIGEIFNARARMWIALIDRYSLDEAIAYTDALARPAPESTWKPTQPEPEWEGWLRHRTWQEKYTGTWSECFALLRASSVQWSSELGRILADVVPGDSFDAFADDLLVSLNPVGEPVGYLS